FQAGDFGNADDLAATAGEAAGLDDELDGAGDLVAHGACGDVVAGHHDHDFDTRQGVAGVVGVNRGHGAFVTGVHGLEHVQGLGAAALADDHAIGAHTQAVLDQVALIDFAFAFDVGRSGLEAHDVGLLELEFGGVLDGDDAFVGGDVAAQ